MFNFIFLTVNSSFLFADFQNKRRVNFDENLEKDALEWLHHEISTSSESDLGEGNDLAVGDARLLDDDYGSDTEDILEEQRCNYYHYIKDSWAEPLLHSKTGICVLHSLGLGPPVSSNNAANFSDSDGHRLS